MLSNKKISVIGQGYVGLPLTIAFSKYFKTIGFDINQKKINLLKKGIDQDKIINQKFLNKNLSFSYNQNDLKNNNIYIIAVPTPIKRNKKPDLRKLIKATKIVAKYINPNDIVIYESTVYPGTTEDVCVPIIEKISGLKLSKNIRNKNFKTFGCGYCPERMNPGDKNRTIDKIVKVISASSDECLEIIFQIYNKVSKVGLCKAKTIKIAESAKIIENVQRDINIALINEFSILFKKMNLNIWDILDVAKTKWNFLNFTPGLVGGHCIGVDPYYLTFKAKQLKYNPKLILAGRQINDNMVKYVFQDLNKIIKKKFKIYKNLKILILGFSFKANVGDFRNSKIIEIVKKLKKNKYVIDIYDPHINISEIKGSIKFNFIKKLMVNKRSYDVVLNAVNHDIFKNINTEYLKKIIKKNGFIYDIADKFPRKLVAGSI